MPIFDPESLQRQVDRVLADIPSGHTHALLAHVNTQGEWVISYAQRIGTSWTLGAEVRRTHARGIEGGVVVEGSW